MRQARCLTAWMPISTCWATTLRRLFREASTWAQHVTTNAGLYIKKPADRSLYQGISQLIQYNSLVSCFLYTLAVLVYLSHLKSSSWLVSLTKRLRLSSNQRSICLEHFWLRKSWHPNSRPLLPNMSTLSGTIFPLNKLRLVASSAYPTLSNLPMRFFEWPPSPSRLCSSPSSSSRTWRPVAQISAVPLAPSADSWSAPSC